MVLVALQIELPTPSALEPLITTTIMRIGINPQETRQVLSHLADCSPTSSSPMSQAILVSTRNEYLNHLAYRAKALPDVWVCEACAALHSVDQWDLPRAPRITCPLGMKQWNHKVYNKPARLDERNITLDHRHVQLALKYTRMKDTRYRGYLRALLEPQRNQDFRPFAGLDENPSYLKVQYLTHPKIVEGPDGRPHFLLRSTWRYNYTCKNVIGRMSRASLGDLTICPHTGFCDEEYRCLYGNGGYINPTLEDAVDEALDMAQVDGDGDENNDEVDDDNDGEDEDGDEDEDGVRGWCPWCPTDFRVRASRKHIEIRAWQDMGTEGSPTDPEWRVHVASHGQDGGDDLGPATRRGDGSAREMFEAKQERGLRRPGAWHVRSRIRRVWAGSGARQPAPRDGGSSRFVEGSCREGQKGGGDSAVALGNGDGNGGVWL
ncbi:hypothetical protein Hte_012429 [Hypoxylon texense]